MFRVGYVHDSIRGIECETVRRVEVITAEVQDGRRASWIVE